MGDSERIDLAHVPGFTLGRLSVNPGTRELVRDDGEREILEPRVMQVLIALVRARGAIVTRDELGHWCWDDRIVGEDAINRVISRVRRAAEGIGAGSFKLETLTKVGYRLTAGNAAPSEPAQPPVLAPARRRLLIGSAAAAIVAAGGATFLLTRSASAPARPPVSPEIAALMQQAQLALRQATPEGQNQALGLYRRVVTLAPDYADGWGALGMAYASTAHFRATPESEAMHARARAAGQRALALDPGNSFGQVALATGQPMMDHWLAIERAIRHAASEHAGDDMLLCTLGRLLSQVGRNAEAAATFEAAAKLAPPAPDIDFTRIVALWAANRMEETDRLIAEAIALYPTHFAIWFARFYILMYSGRVGEAIALGENREGRPSGIPESEFDSILVVARAIQSGTPADADVAMREHLARARLGCGYAENTIQFACALGRLDDAFAVVNAYYFDRGFKIPEVRFTPQQGSYLPRRDRLVAFLFSPSTAPLRRDPRFDRLVGELGLQRYWRESGRPPDYQLPGGR